MNELLSLESKLRFLIMYSTSWETPFSSHLRKIRSFCRQPSVSTSCFSIKTYKKKQQQIYMITHSHKLLIDTKNFMKFYIFLWSVLHTPHQIHTLRSASQHFATQYFHVSSWCSVFFPPLPSILPSIVPQRNSLFFKDQCSVYSYGKNLK